MGLFSKLKDKKEDFFHLQGADTNAGASSSQHPPSYNYHPPPGPPPDQSSKASEQYFAPPSGPPPEGFGPPSHSYDQPPSGPPPNFDAAGPSYHQYAPPPGPPPTLPGYIDYSNHTNTGDGHRHDAPPPAIPQWTSPTSNASEDEAVRGHAFCRAHPIAPPVYMNPQDLDRKASGDFGIQQPLEFLGEVTRRSATVTDVKSRPENPDALLLSSFPLYSVVSDQPREKDKKVVYYEVTIKSLGHSNSESSVAIGYSAVPYPAWRLPGWHRGSVGIHSDDGRRYVNDSYGGKDFTGPFQVGDTVGIGMRFRMQRAEVFFVRNAEEAGSWWIDEEVDSDDVQEGGIDGLQGDADLYAAIGIFGGAEVEVDFGRKVWSDA